ncbi:glycosyltransferase [Mangrovimonas sp. TPBH4]|uniref:glycosyltransferase n=1 Tax=Mangrovimonas sp. TPBH4 TaxID=1645914 RepID=UPI0006B55A8A|nr:glycosyltransferase [Mangrovimonas sp. TPBH4]
MNDSKIDILFVLPSLKAGGAERVISFIAANLDTAKFNSILIVIGSAKDSVYNTGNLNVVFLKQKRVLFGIPFLFSYLITKRPNIIVGSISHVNRVIVFLSCFLPKSKVVGREASVPSIMQRFALKQHRINIPVLKNYHKYLNAIICQSQDMALDLQNNFNIAKSKIHVINNPITENFGLKIQNSTYNTKKKLITVGRLSKEKGHQRILVALSKVNFDYQYTIIGSGPEKDSIFKLATELGIVNKICHIPFTKNVENFLLANDVFIQGSYVEGFPNALLECCAVGTPVIAFNAPGGTKEIIMNGINGYIVNDELEFTEKLHCMLFEKEWNHKKIKELAEKKFNKDNILKQYESLFLELTKS